MAKKTEEQKLQEQAQKDKLQKLQEQVQDVFDNGKQYQWEDVECEARQYGDSITVTVSKMYDHLPLTFDMLLQLKENLRHRKVHCQPMGSSWL
jgi:hypothetical protein